MQRRRGFLQISEVFGSKVTHRSALSELGMQVYIEYNGTNRETQYCKNKNVCACTCLFFVRIVINNKYSKTVNAKSICINKNFKNIYIYKPYYRNYVEQML